MFDLEAVTARAKAECAPYRWVIQQATCRACGNVHEREIGLMREHSPGSWIRVLEPADQAAHSNAPVEFQPCALAWCEACHSKAAANLTAKLRELIDRYANTTELARHVESALFKFENEHRNERFHHGANNATQQKT